MQIKKATANLFSTLKKSTVKQPVLKPVVVEQAPKDRVDLTKSTQNAVQQQTSVTETAKPQKTKPNPTELLLTLKGIGKEARTQILTDYAGLLASRPGASEEEKTRLLGVVSMNRAMKEIRKQHPKASKAELRRAASSSPVLKKWTDLADQAATVLKHKDPQDTAQAMSEAKAKMERIKAIYSGLSDHLQESAKKRQKIYSEAHEAISKIHEQNRKSARDLFQSQSSEWMRINLGTQNSKGQWVW